MNKLVICETCTMGFRTTFVYLYILTNFPYSCCTNTSTVCYGSPGISCTTHRLSCPSPLVIQIINTLYGYRPGCNNIIGLSDCINTTCCNEEPNDRFILFTSEEDNQVVKTCNGVENCTITGYRDIYGTRCGLSSAYSKIQYDCVSNDTSVLTCPTTSDNLVVIVVGGVLGTLLIISVIINVGLIVYFMRRKTSTNSAVENTYNDMTFTERDQHMYDGLQVQPVASSSTPGSSQPET